MKISAWPAWFPYPISWLRGFALSQSFGFIVVSGLSSVTDNVDFFILLGLAWVTQLFLFTFIHYLVSCSVEFAIAYLPKQIPGYERIYQWLLSKRCLGKWRHWREGLNAFIVTVVAITLSLAIAVIFIASPANRQESFWKLNIALYSLPISAAYVYQYDLWVRIRRAEKLAKQAEKTAKQKQISKETAQRKAAKKTPKPQNPQPPVDPIEVELNEMSSEFGMTSMRSVRKPPDPNKTQWYVFRNGPVGPYTRKQLWLEQKITARTKVRREGETEWTRAGEIPELKDFLGTKT